MSNGATEFGDVSKDLLVMQMAAGKMVELNKDVQISQAATNTCKRSEFNQRDRIHAQAPIHERDAMNMNTTEALCDSCSQ